MLKSIRWQLQLWYAAILVLAVAGISLASILAIRQARYSEIDSELEAAGQVLALITHGPPRRTGGGPRGPDFGFNNNHPFDQPPPDDFGPDGHQRRFDRLPPFLLLPPGFLQRYGGTETDARSFVIYRNDGTIVKQWGVPIDQSKLPPASVRPPGAGLAHRAVGDVHQVLLAGPEGTTLLASGSVQGVNNELHALVIQLIAVGAGVLVTGLVGGWVISLLTLRPIARMSQTAGLISATRLGERIDARVVPSELRQLAMVLNAAFDRLEAAFAQQARFTADASHELRTPLAVIMSHAELALSRDRSSGEYRKTIETCLSASARMKALVESLLLLSHADQGELAIQPVPMDLSDVVRENVNLLTTLANQRSITIATRLQNATLTADPLRVGQVVANLLSNAIRYNREGGNISVFTEISASDAVLTIADTGLGISMEDQGHVFDRFFRADKARSRVVGGSGLGLAICKSIVDAHGGSIQLTSEPGNGSTFSVRFPRGAVEMPTRALPSNIELTSDPSSSRPASVLRGKARI